MTGLPKGLLKKVIDEGYDPPEAMKEAWRRVKTQQKRYATRMSYGGGYPLGYKAYKGKNPRKRKPHKIPFGQWIKAVEKEFDLAGIHPKWSGFTAKKLYKVYTPKKAAEKLILESKRRKGKNPKRITVTGFEDETTKDIQVDLHTREVAPPHLRDQKLMAAMREELYRRQKKKPRKNPSEYSRGYADGKAAKQMKFRRGTAKDLGKASADYINGYVDGYQQRKPAKKNPIAIYNPPGKQKLLYGRAYIPVIRGIKTNGKYKGEKYEHKFSKNEVSIYGNPDGSLIIKSNNNLRLWNYDKDI